MFIFDWRVSAAVVFEMIHQPITSPTNTSKFSHQGHEMGGRLLRVRLIDYDLLWPQFYCFLICRKNKQNSLRPTGWQTSLSWLVILSFSISRQSPASSPGFSSLSVSCSHPSLRAFCPLPCLFKSPLLHDTVTSLRDHRSHELPQRIVAKLRILSSVSVWNTLTFFGHPVLTFSPSYHAWTPPQIASSFPFLFSPRTNPQCLGSLPPDHPLLCLHLCSLHRSYDVTAAWPLFCVTCIRKKKKSPMLASLLSAGTALFIPHIITSILLHYHHEE